MSEKELKDVEQIVDVDGGEISSEVPEQQYRFDEVKHKADTTRWLAIAFIILFAFSFVGHYAATAFFHGFGMSTTAEYLSSVFDKWSTGITALTGSVVTYYFTKEK